MSQKFEANFDSLSNYQCPNWFRDAKFGIWSHWGPQSVPMFGDWYARFMYIQGTPQYRYHLRHYGHPSKFGYKDICKLWKAEKFDPDALMELYTRAGAKYFVAQAMHHDHFFNYPSQYNRFNSVEIGPHKDICGLWKKAAEKHGLPFGLTEHLGASFSWFSTNKGRDTYGPFQDVPYDGNDPEYRDFYYDNGEHYQEFPQPTPLEPWYTSNRKFWDYWLKVMKEMIDKYQPDMLYTDGPLPFGEMNKELQASENYRLGLEAVAHLYNRSIEKYGKNHAVYTQKDRRPEIYQIGVLDIEKSQLPGIQAAPWQTDTCIGNWFYDAACEFKKAGHIIEMLVDIISKNGTMLLNILQKPDGSIDEETTYLLEELADWFPVCGEGVYGTRPWRVNAEGDSRVVINGFQEDAVAWNPSDFRFTQKGSTVYAFMMRVPENRVAVLKSFTPDEKVKRVRLLGMGEVPFEQSFGVLTVKLPEALPTKYTNCFAVEL
ncbi:alpha-L-fucosidase [Massiliimalia timonensis]|uniref:alpha-L-fucosidase n=1 Tax=Massiliimalia timonensis TaxID=1987501 RepID=UPI000B8B0A7C|nr:alpha-L-fucosidase [Massiliimalia timonensis]